MPCLAKGSGRAGGKTLGVPAGAGPAGMGEVFVAGGGGVDALSYNPAGLAETKGHEASLSYMKGMVDENYGALGWSGDLGKAGSFGVNVVYYDGGKLEWNRQDGTTETVKAQKDVSINAGWAKGIGERMSFGVGIKYLSSKLADRYSASAFAGDIGAACKTGVDGLTVALSVMNVGTKIKYLDEGDPVAMMIRAGVMYSGVLFEGHSVTGGLDIVKPDDGGIAENAGVEYSYAETAFLRAGYRFSGDLNKLSVGAGYQTMGVRLDYAVAALSTINPVHRVTLTYKISP